MSEDIQVQGEEQLATVGSRPHPEGMGDKPEPGSVYEARERLPEHVVSEVIGGELYVSPQPTQPHIRAAYRLGLLLGPFDMGREGLGGWLIRPEPELHLRADILVPDLAGWRRERLPAMPQGVAVTVAPDWVCEVLSPSTERLDRGRKMAIYAREGVKHLWLMDPRIQSLEVHRLEAGGWARLSVHSGNAVVRAEPFEALALELAPLWKD
jgi:Uma2 family endonuclease